jgi:hypothetical protein
MFSSFLEKPTLPSFPRNSMECIFSSTAQHAPTDLGKHERKKEGKKKEKEITSNKSKV